MIGVRPTPVRIVATCAAKGWHELPHKLRSGLAGHALASFSRQRTKSARQRWYAPRSNTD
jgi:hypothetical protein